MANALSGERSHSNITICFPITGDTELDLISAVNRLLGTRDYPPDTKVRALKYLLDRYQEEAKRADDLLRNIQVLQAQQRSNVSPYPSSPPPYHAIHQQASPWTTAVAAQPSNMVAYPGGIANKAKP